MKNIAYIRKGSADERHFPTFIGLLVDDEERSEIQYFLPEIVNTLPEIVKRHPETANDLPEMCNEPPEVVRALPEMFNGSAETVRGHPYMFNAFP